MGRRSSIYLADDALAKMRIDEDGGIGPSAAVNRIVDRYDVMMGLAAEEVDAIFSADEWKAMLSACNGTRWEPAATIKGGVLADIIDTQVSEIEYYGADKKQLLFKLTQLDIIQQFALVDMIEQWWVKEGRRGG